MVPTSIRLSSGNEVLERRPARVGRRGKDQAAVVFGFKDFEVAEFFK
jgi:hypothetical protein